MTPAPKGKGQLPDSRQWLTEGEIDGKIGNAIHDLMGEIRDMMGEQNQMIHRQNDILDKVADGVQSVLLTNTVTHGNPALGIKGQMAEVQENVKGLHEDMVGIKDEGNRRHAENLKRFRSRRRDAITIKKSQQVILDSIAARDHRLRKRLVALKDLLQKHVPTMAADWKRLTAAFGAAISGYHIITHPQQSWTTLKLLLGKLAAIASAAQK